MTQEELLDPRRGRSSRILGAALFAATSVFLAVAAYPRMFSILLPWDDEGYFLISLRSFRRKGGLYDRVFSYTGPLYYLVMDGLFGGLRLAASQKPSDTSRPWS